MSKFLRSPLWFVVLAISLLGQAFAQGGATGAITGTVLDQSGAVVANADIRIINQDTGTVTRITKTDATGRSMRRFSQSRRTQYKSPMLVFGKQRFPTWLSASPKPRA